MGPRRTQEEEVIVSQRWLNYLLPLEVQNPVFGVHR